MERQRGRQPYTHRKREYDYIHIYILLLDFNKLLVHRVFICKDFYIVLLVIQKSSESQ